MSATGIGAAVRRKEDQRFITGKGHYTDDVNRPGQASRVFRALAARARQDQEHRQQGRGRDAGRAGRAHRRRACRRQDRQSHLRLDDPFQGRLADEDGAASGDRPRQGLLCRRSGRGRHRRDAGAGEGRRREGEGRLRGAAGGRRSGQGARRRARRRSTRSRRDNTIYQWHLGDAKAADAAFKAAKHVTRLDHRQQPAGAERDRAARGDRRIRCRHRQLHALEHDAEPARGAARHLGLRRHGARAQAARDRARRRRRLRLEDLHLSGGGRGAVGLEARSAGR